MTERSWFSVHAGERAGGAGVVWGGALGTWTLASPSLTPTDGDRVGKYPQQVEKISSFRHLRWKGTQRYKLILPQ